MRWKSLAIVLTMYVVPLSALQNPARTVSLEGVDVVPRIVNGTLNQRALNGSLAAAMGDVARSTDTKVWTGYAIPAAMLKQGLSSYSDCCSECSLEIPGNRYFTSDRLAAGAASPN